MDNNQNNNQNNENNRNGENPRRQNIFLLLIAALITMLCMTYFMRTMTQSDTQEITYNEFVQMLESGEVSKIVIESDRITVTPVEKKSVPNHITYYTGIAEDADTLTQRVLEYNAGLDSDSQPVSISSKIPDNSGVIMSLILYYVLPIALIWVLLSFVTRRMSKNMGPLGMGRKLLISFTIPVNTPKSELSFQRVLCL